MQGPICASCVQANPLGANFCVYCAAALHTPSPVAPLALQPTYATAGASQASLSTLALNGDPLLNLVLRGVWFAFIGWWLGLVWTIFAWLFNVSLIGLPVGLAMLNMIPQVMTLQPRKGSLQVSAQAVGSGAHVPEHPLALRALWFLAVGWWASLLWMLLAWAFSASLLLLPVSFWMFNRVPTITTLAAER